MLNSDLSAEVIRAKGVEATKLSLIHTTSPTVAQLKTADIVIVRLGRSGLSAAGSAVLYPNVPVLCDNIIYDGSSQQLGGVTCEWNRTNGTVVLTGGTGMYYWNQIIDYYLLQRG